MSLLSPLPSTGALLDNLKRKSLTEQSYPVKRVPVSHRSPAADHRPFSIPSPVNQSQHETLAAYKGPFQDDDECTDDDVTSTKDRPVHKHSEHKTSIGSNAVPDSGQDPQNSVIDHLNARTSKGHAFNLRSRSRRSGPSYERLIAARSTHASGKARTSFYGVDIHSLLDQASKVACGNLRSHACPARTDLTSRPLLAPSLKAGKRTKLLWTERYRARKFTDLVGDDRLHREVLRWLKAWDPIVFHGSKPSRSMSAEGDHNDSKAHRKILLLAGPPGFGKTTLAHVLAKQAGYDTLEINASDDRSSQIVRGRIKDCLGTENVRNDAKLTGTKRARVSKPTCVIVDEVDGVVTGSSTSGEGGFIKALLDLAMMDQRHSTALAPASHNIAKSRGKRDRFRILRPLILICNDVHHPSLRPLRTSSLAEIIYMRKAPFDKVVSRLRSIFDQEGVKCDGAGVQKLCEMTWGVTRNQDGCSQANGDGDLRGCLVAGEWAASKLRASSQGQIGLTKAWVEDNISDNVVRNGHSRGVGRGGIRGTVERVFLENAGFPKVLGIPVQEDSAARLSDVGVAEATKRNAMSNLREVVETAGEHDRIITDCFMTYGSQPFQDDVFLSKPNAACEWLQFHDQLSSRVNGSHDWELSPYFPYPLLGFHDLFASPFKRSWQDRDNQQESNEQQSLFTGPRAHSAALESMKANHAALNTLHCSLSVVLARSFRSTGSLVTELLPYLNGILTPDVKPVVVGGGGEIAGIVSVRTERDRQLLDRAVRVMHEIGVVFERTRVETGRHGQCSYVYRMEP